MRSDISPISSRNTVPPWACSKRPGLSRTAPVKLPRTWPKSSDSSSDSGTPAQLSVEHGACARWLRTWIRRAATSLPTPLSPVMSTLASERAAMRDLLVERLQRRRC